MRHCLIFFAILFVPVVFFAQTGSDIAFICDQQPTGYSSYNHQRDSTFSFLVNMSADFYTVKDARINGFLNKYGYTSPQNLPVGIHFELAAIPAESNMMYGINAFTIISPQSIITADFSIGIYRRFFVKKNFWILGGLSLGTHYDRIVLNGNLPPKFDSIANQYHRTLSLHRVGLFTEPTAKVFWYPLQKQKFQLGFVGGIGYDLDFNSRWKLGYYNQNGSYTTFHRIKQSANVQTHQEFGWAFNAGLSACFIIL